MRRSFLVISLISTLMISCQDKYDKIKRIPEAANLEEKLRKDVLCDDAIITIDNKKDDNPTLKIILINSKDVTLDKPDEFKKNYSWNLSCLLIEHFFTPPYIQKSIEIMLVEKTNFIIQFDKYNSYSYAIQDVLTEIDKRKKNKTFENKSDLKADSILLASPSH